MQSMFDPRITGPLGFGLGGLSWVISHFNWPVPDIVAYGVLAGSIILVAFAITGALLKFTDRLRAKGGTPVTVITVGLLIVVFGLLVAGIGLWQLNQFPGRSDVTAEPIDVQEPPPTRITAYDLGMRLKTIDDLLERLRTDFEPLRVDGHALLAKVRNAVDSGGQMDTQFATLDVELLAFAEKFETATKEWWEVIADSKHQEFRDMMNASNKLWDISKPSGSARDLAGEIVRLRNSHQLNISSYLENNRFLHAFKEAMTGHGVWIQNFGNELKRKRHEYSNAEPA